MTNDAPHSVLLALYPGAEVARALAVQGGEDAAELHLTLCYLGAVEAETLGSLEGRIAEVAARHAPLEGAVSGWGCFAPSVRTEGREVLWASVDVPGLTELREELARLCTELGAPPSDQHTYQPHITLAYREPGSGPTASLERTPLTFDSIALVNGSERTELPLGRPVAQKMERAGEPPVGVWDTVCTFGSYQHETVNGRPVITVHDASTCKVMLDDFAAHPECDIFYDKQHEVVDALGDEALDREAMREWGEGDGHALAWANALVMILGGQVARYEPHPGAPQEPPTPDAVLRQRDGTMRPDGVYCLRSQVTPRGADPIGGLSAFRWTSPYFVPEKDGNRLLNLTATNDPRMRDCALAFSREGRVAMQRVTPAQKARTAQSRTAMEKAPMAKTKMEDKAGKTADQPEMGAVMAAAGCAEGDSPDVKLAKMAAYARKMEEASNASEMEEAEEPKAAAPKEASKAEADKPECPAGDEAEQELLRRIQALEEKNAMLQKELAESKGTMQRFKAMEQKTKEQEAQTFARSAIAMGRMKGDHKGSIDDTTKWLAAKYLKSPEDAEDLLSAEGTFQISERIATTRYTAGGAGIGAPAPRADMSPSDEVDALIATEIKALQGEGSKEKDLTSVAMGRVKKKYPAAWSRYTNRNRG